MYVTIRSSMVLYLHKLKGYVRNKAHPEDSIAKGYIDCECLTFCSLYLDDVETIFNRPYRNLDGDGHRSSLISTFSHNGHGVGAPILDELNSVSGQRLDGHVLMCSEHKELLLSENVLDIDARQLLEFSRTEGEASRRRSPRTTSQQQRSTIDEDMQAVSRQGDNAMEYRLRAHYEKFATYDEVLQHCPHAVLEDDWRYCIEQFKSEKFQEDLKSDHEFDQFDLWYLTHFGSKKSKWVDERSKEDDDSVSRLHVEHLQAHCPVNRVRVDRKRVIWTLPSAGYVKINVDGALKEDNGVTGVGVAIRNSDGDLMAALFLSFKEADRVAHAVARHALTLDSDVTFLNEGQNAFFCYPNDVMKHWKRAHRRSQRAQPPEGGNPIHGTQ
ncbi:hypothetical protein FEM48_Zijuj10G0071900 [Ziziphus jujuba var. spinosa]|uniref:DUF4218 domain-containing protein n=1 Tax=Ziziphus jujuba var. spinosa TaxID=714518 RepID=A0A978UM14_ZIZJJ|nr:hypothetical protein FEM48_Zijuj10G0071900 [Ziziphus jujuba var. spinosa]